MTRIDHIARSPDPCLAAREAAWLFIPSRFPYREATRERSATSCSKLPHQHVLNRIYACSRDVASKFVKIKVLDDCSSSSTSNYKTFCSFVVANRNLTVLISPESSSNSDSGDIKIVKFRLETTKLQILVYVCIGVRFARRLKLKMRARCSFIWSR